jgi:hypothetical protein
VADLCMPMATCSGTPDAGNLHVRCDGGGATGLGRPPLPLPVKRERLDPGQDRGAPDEPGRVAGSARLVFTAKDANDEEGVVRSYSVVEPPFED